ncbi:MAG: recombinase family protein [bacterium]
MQNTQNKIKYFLYARKSSESEDKQVQSIKDQLSTSKKLADNLNLDVIKEPFTEAKSAKIPNNRPVFNEMIRRIENGEADGILCWHINRLSRNPVDSGKLSWLLQQGIIKSIRTIDREYLPSDNVLMFSLESGSANQYILDLSKAVKRGIETKLQKGWMPDSAPLGYLNTKIEVRGENYIIKDPERFSIIRKIWELMLTGNYTPPQILEKANNEWGLRTRKTRRRGGKPISRSTIYRIFTNPFYAGTIFFKGNYYEGKHDPMVTLDEFDRVQMLLGRKGKPRPKQHHFAFTGAIRCAECGCLFTAIEKTKIIKATGNLKTFTYYYCTRKKREINCSQHKHIPLENLELQIEKEIEKYTILPEFLQWALECLNKNNDKEIEDRSKIHESQCKALLEAQKQLDELTKMRYRQLIDDDTFTKEKNELQIQIAQLKEKLRETESRAEHWLELTEKTFNFATYARQAFIAAKGQEGLELKKEILMALGKTPVIKEGKLIIEPNEWFVPIQKAYPALEKEYLGLELGENSLNKAKTEALTSVRAQWRVV